MAISTQAAVLKWGAAAPGTISGLYIKDFPDLGGAPEMIETTTLNDTIQTFILGIQSMNAMEFTYNFTKAVYDLVYADASTAMKYSLTFSDNTVVSWEGSHVTYITGAGVNDVIEAKIVIAPTSQPVVS